MATFNQDKKEKPETSPTQAVEQLPVITADPTVHALGIITFVNLDSSELTIRPLGADESIVLTYTGASDIRTKSNRPVSAAVLNIGDIVDVNYTSDNRISSLSGSKDVWIYKNVGNLSIDTELEKMTVGDTIYRYDDNLVVLNEGIPVSFEELAAIDTFNLYGIDNYIYVVKVANGHGYLSLANYSGFIDGTISIGHGRTEMINEGFNILLPEGEYNVTATKDEHTASAVIKISNGSTSYFDLAGQGSAPVAKGNVHFNIFPAESDLYVDGIKVSHYLPVELSYGDHTVEAVLGGYNDYTGTINVNRADTTLSISLSSKSPSDIEDILYNDTSSDNVWDATLPDVENNISDINDTIPDTTTDDSDYSNLPVINGDDNDTSSDSDETIPDFMDSSEDYVDSTEDPDEKNNYVEDPDNDSTTTDTPGNSSPTVSVSIYCSNGVSVYADSNYIGTIADGHITFDCAPGSISIKLSKDGYLTKNYSITVDSDDDEVTFRFPDLTKE